MKPLDPPIVRRIGNLEIVALESASQAKGLVASLSVGMPGEAARSLEPVMLGDPARREVFARTLAAKAGADEGAVEATLVDLAQSIIAVRVDEVRRAKARKPRVPDTITALATADEAAPPAIRERAERLLRDPGFLWRAARVVHLLGVEGEVPAILTIYLIATTRLLPDAAAATVKGDPSIGKNYVVKKTLQLIPPREIVAAEAVSGRALYHIGEGLRRKVLVITEVAGASAAQESVRWITSEGQLRMLITIKDPKTGEFRTEPQVVPGPTAVIETTPDAELKEDDETRNLSVFLNGSPEQTKKVLVRLAKLADDEEPIADEEVEVFREAQRILGGPGTMNRVRVPFAGVLANAFPTHMVRARRDFGRLLTLIKAIAFLHQFQRHRDAKGRILAQPEDYFYGAVVSEEFFRRSLARLPPQSQEILETAQKEFSSYETVEGQGRDEHLVAVRPEFTRADIADKGGKSLDWVEKWARPLQNAWFEVVEGGKGRRYKYRLRTASVVDLRLPDWTTLPTVPTGSDAGESEPAVEPALPLAANGCRTSDGSDGHTCIFNPLEADPSCPKCHARPDGASEVAAARPDQQERNTSDAPASEVVGSVGSSLPSPGTIGGSDRSAAADADGQNQYLLTPPKARPWATPAEPGLDLSQQARLARTVDVVRSMTTGGKPAEQSDVHKALVRIGHSAYHAITDIDLLLERGILIRVGDRGLMVA